jgi:hypothetical protein
MNRKPAVPPRLAKWLLSFACPRGQADPLAGDILERLHEGQTGLWFWRQVLFAGSLRLRRAAQSRWPQLVFATVGLFLPLFRFSDARTYAATALQWWTQPWPWSQLLFELSGPALFAVAALPILGLGLRIQGTFQWANLFRTGAINSALVLLWMLITHAVMPYLMHPVVGRHYTRGLPDAGVTLLQFALHAVIFLVPFALFLLAAWLGCRPSSRAESPRRLA